MYFLSFGRCKTVLTVFIWKPSTWAWTCHLEIRSSAAAVPFHLPPVDEDNMMSNVSEGQKHLQYNTYPLFCLLLKNRPYPQSRPAGCTSCGFVHHQPSSLLLSSCSLFLLPFFLFSSCPLFLLLVFFSSSLFLLPCLIFFLIFDILLSPNSGGTFAGIIISGEIGWIVSFYLICTR